MTSEAKTELDSKALAKYIDHTLLRPDASEKEIEILCNEAKEFQFFSVCIEAKWIAAARAILKNTPVKVITVISFPKGNDPTEQKIRDTRVAVAAGADEVDMVLNRELLALRRYRDVMEDIRQVVHSAGGKPVKVILETSELSPDEKVIACALSKAAGAAFVKTSTGFSKSGANAADVALMRRIVGPEIGVKASGGVRTRETALAMIEAGADRLGTSASCAIVQNAKVEGGNY